MKKAARTPMEGPQQRAYVGPSFKGVAYGTVFLGELPGHLQEGIARTPAIGELVVPIDKLPEAMKEAKDPGSHLGTLYQYVLGELKKQAGKDQRQ